MTLLTPWWTALLALALGQFIWAPAPAHGLDNGLALTPPMGWLSWERFTCVTDCQEYPGDCINSNLYEQMAERLKEDGYAQLGYQYVNIDDCWSERERDSATGSLVADRSRFPGGIGKLADQVHKMGLKLGIYGDCGTATCAGYPGQLKSEQAGELEDNYFVQDANSLAEWQVDSFKFDGCNLDPAKAESICPQMAKALNATNRPVLVVCEWPDYMLNGPKLEPDWGLAQQACNAWRYYADVEDSWLSVLGIISYTTRMQDTIVKYHGPGHWFDPDQLVIGNFALSLDQARAQMAIWCLWSAPLYMSNDLLDITPEMAAVLKNKDLIDVNQDPWGVFGLLVGESKDGKHQAFAKPVHPIVRGCPSFVIVYLNRDTLGNSQKFSFDLRNLLKKSQLPIEVAAERHAKLAADKVDDFVASKCMHLLNLAMTQEVGLAVPLNRPLNQAPFEQPVEERQVYFNVVDLFDSKQAIDKVALNGSLVLSVNPSGVRAVKLIQEA